MTSPLTDSGRNSSLLADGMRLIDPGVWLPEIHTAESCRSDDYLMIFDCAIGDISGDFRLFEHNNAAAASEMRGIF